MADPDGELTVAQRLGRALDRGILPAGGPAEAAERLIERLERPARVALLGLPGSGKSSILNLLVGSVVVSETLRLPTIIVQHGTEARMICTLTDGSTRIVPGSDLSQILALAPALVTLEMDLPALKVISLLEVSAGPMEAEQRRAASWASKRADIVIWCTTSYLPKEQAVWESLPDAVKDNSFMFLTKVDLLGNRQAASSMHDRVEQRAGEDFRQILSISAKQARAAMPAGGPVNRDLFRDSGASGVITAIKTRVQSGRRADMDTAELLLARHVEASELVARRFAEPGVEPARPWTPPPEAEEAEAAAVEPPEVEPEAEEEVVNPVFAEEVQEETDFSEADDGVVEDAEEDLPEEEQPAAEVEDWTEPEAEEEPEPEVVEEPEPEPEVAAVVEAPPVEEAEPEPTTRKRFADRIKRVASSTELASTPLVPLRATWKSKAETEAPPEPEPVARPAEPVRRPRPAAPVASDQGDVARMLAKATPAPERPVVPRERTPRATPVTPPPPVADAPRSARPQLFGARRGSNPTEPGSPLPDLSSLRAQPELDDTDLENLIEEPELDADLAAEDAEASLPEPEREPEPEPEALEPEPEVAEIPPVVEPPKPIERPRLFDRGPRAKPAEPPPAPVVERQPGAAPVSRRAAPPRPQAPVETPEAKPRAPEDDAQFSPRAIMARERPAGPDAAAPRRERTRIAARAVAAPAAPAAPTQAASADHAILDEAVSLIIARATELDQSIDPEAKMPVDMILDHSRETTEAVIAVVSRGRTDELRRINSDLGEVLDVIMLMQLEKGHAPADDALTLLLQLRRELETLRVA